MKWLAEMVMNEERIGRVRALSPVAKELGCTMAQLAIAWCLKNPNVSSVITGASRKEQVVENMKALEISKGLDDALMKRIDTILGNKPKDAEH
jgi:aryl-alcohol dehydrogenase-like predicted oxidoreductase